MTTTGPTWSFTTVPPVNRPPTATGQSVTTPEDTAKAITLAGSDPDGDSLAYAVTTQPSHGTLSGVAPNVTYVPASDYSGPDSFTFTVTDGPATSESATVSVNVTAVNDAPVCANGSSSTPEDTVLSGSVVCTDVDSTVLTYAKASDPAYGSLSLATDGSFGYTPTGDYHGSDGFTFTASDGELSSEAATWAITVTPVNDAPTATPQAVSTDEGAAVGITLAGSDIDGDVLTYAIVDGPVHGSLTGTAPNLTYTPNSGYSGSDAFTFTVSDESLPRARPPCPSKSGPPYGVPGSSRKAPASHSRTVRPTTTTRRCPAPQAGSWAGSATTLSASTARSTPPSLRTPAST